MLVMSLAMFMSSIIPHQYSVNRLNVLNALLVTLYHNKMNEPVEITVIIETDVKRSLYKCVIDLITHSNSKHQTNELSCREVRAQCHNVDVLYK